MHSREAWGVSNVASKQGDGIKPSAKAASRSGCGMRIGSNWTALQMLAFLRYKVMQVPYRLHREPDTAQHATPHQRSLRED